LRKSNNFWKLFFLRKNTPQLYVCQKVLSSVQMSSVSLLNWPLHFCSGRNVIWNFIQLWGKLRTLEKHKCILNFLSFCLLSSSHSVNLNLCLQIVTCLLPKKCFCLFWPSTNYSFSECAFHKVTTKEINMDWISLHDPQY